MMWFQAANIILLPLFFLVLAVLLYFVVKLAIKHAIKELKEERIL